MRHLLSALLPSLIISLSIMSTPAAAQQTAPSTAGGFTLNSPISDYTIERHENYLSEVIITDLKGFRKGFITYGTCENPGRILRIKLKYHDRSYKFFEELLERYKQSFGEKPKFSGDRFGNVKSWKWEFVNKDSHRVTLVLQHNLKDTDESMGNMVKLSMPELMDSERLCFNESIENKGADSKQGQEKDIEWEILIPR